MYYIPPPLGFGTFPTDAGIPNEEQVVQFYSQLRKINIENWNFYIAFSFFRMCGILQGVYKRALQGNASAPNALEYGPAVPLFATKAMAIALKNNTSGIQTNAIANFDVADMSPLKMVDEADEFSESTESVPLQLFIFMLIADTPQSHIGLPRNILQILGR